MNRNEADTEEYILVRARPKDQADWTRELNEIRNADEAPILMRPFDQEID